MECLILVSHFQISHKLMKKKSIIWLKTLSFTIRSPALLLQLSMAKMISRKQLLAYFLEVPQKNFKMVWDLEEISMFYFLETHLLLNLNSWNSLRELLQSRSTLVERDPLLLVSQLQFLEITPQENFNWKEEPWS